MKISNHEAETLVRLAASIIDERDHRRSDPVGRALNGFSEAAEVEDLARRVAHYTYYAGEALEIES